MSKLNASQLASNEVVLYANTLDATFNDVGDYTFHLLRPISKVKNIELISYNLNWSFPNVRTSTNALVFSESGSPTKFTVTIPVGNYADEDVAQYIASAMTSAGSQTYTITINFVTEAFTITGSSKNFTVYLSGTTLKDIIGLKADSTSSNNALTLGQMNLLPTT